MAEVIDSAVSTLDSAFMSIDQSTLENPNVQAFLALIKYGESGGDYQVMWGGSHFADFSGHPHVFFTTPDGRRTSAAGAYQITWTTWTALARQYTLADFSPASQDFAAVALIKVRGALADVMAGRFDRAIAKCRPEWTSLPGAMEQGYSLDKAHQIIVAAGGQFEGSTIA
ncbi:glycoside hydrolase family 104 protein [Dechloromonas sp. HYN0024]|uniref:glycoside hydrolase family 24 protein n=1 Tax=Dechloromonas sp. HYN0024 TaxID=2231055 RepID=UPI0013C2DC30|nr:glycoside hydrolase family 104 protein [Dechloromonas sp. HYN0024]